MRINIRPMGTITAPYGEVSPIHTKGHSGIDFSARTGVEITTPFEGVISSIRDYGDANLGKSVFIKLENGYQIAFGHLSKNDFFKVGDIVHAGDVIGLVGNSGRSFGSHLHFMVFDKVGKVLNPEKIFFGYEITFAYFTNKAIQSMIYLPDMVTTLSV